MKTLKYICLLFIGFAFIMGCSGTRTSIKNQSRDESKVTQEKLIKNWSDYDIWFKYTVVAFDPKNDDKKILVEDNWSAVKDQETLTQIVEGTHTLKSR